MSKKQQNTDQAAMSESSIAAIEHGFTISISAVRGILDMVQLIADDQAQYLKVGTIGGATDGALRVLEDVHEKFDELLFLCKKQMEAQS